MSNFIWNQPSTWFSAIKKQPAPIKMQALPISVAVSPSSVIILKRHAARLSRLYEIADKGEWTQEMKDEIERRKLLLQAEKVTPPLSSAEAKLLLKQLGG
jgi:hypothetical protein